MYVIKKDTMTVPLKVWSKKGDIEPQCLEQMERVASLPFARKHTALMPDGHLGVGASIGSVFASSGYIVPVIVGSDIGCGMCFVESNIKDYDRQSLTDVMKEIRYEVPVGFGRHLQPKDISKLPESKNSNAYYEKFLEPSLYQLGTLGGGNHFIELQKNKEGRLCIMIHSGSRNIGKQVADYYNKLAIQINEKYFSSVKKEWQLAFLPLDSNEGQAYLEEMEYCVQFALANRMEMMNACQQAVFKVFKPHQQVGFTNFINIPHNYARMEHHFGENVIVHRKGATSAKVGELGLIPGSQGTKSYIVRGKGNKESFESCSHGAGRKMGRKEAQKTLKLDEQKKILDDLGVIHAVRNADDLDEAPGSYKDIDIVMSEQTDLIDIVEELTPLAVIKG